MRQKRTTPTDKHLGARARAARIEQCYSQGKIAGEFGISFQQLQKYENGINRITAVRLAQMSEHYQKPLTWFFEGSEYDPMLRGEPITDLRAQIFADSAGRRMVETYLALDDIDRAALLQIGQTLARRRTNGGQS